MGAEFAQRHIEGLCDAFGENHCFADLCTQGFQPRGVIDGGADHREVEPVRRSDIPLGNITLIERETPANLRRTICNPVTVRTRNGKVCALGGAQCRGTPICSVGVG